MKSLEPFLERADRVLRLLERIAEAVELLASRDAQAHEEHDAALWTA